MSNLFPKYMAKQMVPSFSKLEVQAVMEQISEEEVEAIREMNNRQSSGKGFMLELEHRVSEEVLRTIQTPTLIVHSVHDNSVLFDHAQHANQHIRESELFEAKTWGHLIWIGKGSEEVNQKVIKFLKH